MHNNIITNTGRHKLVLIDNLDYKTEKQCIDRSLKTVKSDLALRLFCGMAPLLSDQGYWYGLREAYTVCDVPDIYAIEEKRILFTSWRQHRECLMSAAEQRYLQSLPDQITIYRGMTLLEKETGNFGLSWTLSKKVAEFYAYDYMGYAKYNDHKRTVHSLVVDAEKLIAYFSGRREREIIYNNMELIDDLPF
jgi:hypothetical protein